MKDIIRGIFIGIGKVIPGVSGSIIAISLGVYEKAIDAINNLFKDKRNFYYLFKLAIGILFSLIFMGKIVLYFLNKNYLVTVFAFIGLIIGSMDEVLVNVKKKYWLLTIVSFLIISLLGFISLDNNVNISNKVIEFLYYCLAGVMDAFSTVIPGVSGTAILMIMGVYENIMEIFSNLFNIAYLCDNIKIILPFLLGMALGLFIFIKLVTYLFKNFYHQTYNSILGLLYGSIFIMLKTVNYTFPSIIVGIIIMCISYVIVKKINQLL